MLVETGVGERMQREAMFHDGNHLCFNGATHHLNFKELVGKGITIYGQQEVVKDLVAQRLKDGGQIIFEVEDTAVHDFGTDKPSITFRKDGQDQRIDCDFIAGCDGFHGICRPSFPEGALTFYDREYPFGWLGILSDSPPPDDELIYSAITIVVSRFTRCARRRSRGCMSRSITTRTSRTGRTIGSGRSSISVCRARASCRKARSCRRA